MFCPGCGTQIADDTKFCKFCGANLLGVREAMSTRGEKFDWSKTWVAEMFLTEEEQNRRRGVTPEKKRNNELRAGVITSSVGLGAMIFLRYFLEAVAQNEGGPDAVIISRVWICGLIPFLIGAALIFNALVIGRREIKAAQQKIEALPQPSPPQPRLEAPTTNQLNVATDYSVIENTTAHLPERASSIPRRESE